MFFSSFVNACIPSITTALDLARTRIQMRHGSSSLSIINALGEVIKSEGIFRLYRGIIPPIISEVPRRALKFTANDFYKKLLLNQGTWVSVSK